MNPTQLSTLRKLHTALTEASQCGLLDNLASGASPDSINDVCDAVALTVEQVNYQDTRNTIDHLGMNLAQKRVEAANTHFENADLPEIESCNGWESHPDSLSRTVFWTNPNGDSIKGSYHVGFKQGTDEITSSATHGIDVGFIKSE